MADQPIGTCVVVLDENYRVLLGKRKNSYKSGYYGLPGGRIEPGEPIKSAVKRELREEISITATKLSYLGVIRENQGEYSFIHFAYICDKYTGKISLVEPEKCEAWEWFPLENLPINTLRAHKTVVEMISSDSTLVDYSSI